MPTIATTSRFGITNRFDVVVDGFHLGGWAKCEGLSVQFKLHDYVPLGHNDFAPVLPDRVLYSKITLTRAITAEDGPKTLRWLSKMKDAGSGGTAAITLHDSHRQPVMTWKLRGVYPTSWKAPPFDAKGHDIAVETLEVAHQGFLEE
jgi:phage tail-like protein